jgi:hypothetical protein
MEHERGAFKVIRQRSAGAVKRWAYALDLKPPDHLDNLLVAESYCMRPGLNGPDANLISLSQMVIY